MPQTATHLWDEIHKAEAIRNSLALPNALRKSQEHVESLACCTAHLPSLCSRPWTSCTFLVNCFWTWGMLNEGKHRSLSKESYIHVVKVTLPPNLQVSSLPIVLSELQSVTTSHNNLSGWEIYAGDISHPFSSLGHGPRGRQVEHRKPKC